MENLKTKVENRSTVGKIEIRAGYKSRHIVGKLLRPELLEQKTLLDKKTKKGYSPDSLTAEILAL